MPDRFAREEIRTDYVGAYTAYIYPDGHIETDPPGRPISKEDQQRRRLAAATAEKVARMTVAIRTGKGVRGVPSPSDIRRTERDVPTLRALTQGYHDTLTAAGTLAVTARAPEVTRRILTGEFDLGGEVGTREYDVEEPYTGPDDKQAALPPAHIRKVR